MDTPIITIEQAQPIVKFNGEVVDFDQEKRDYVQLKQSVEDMSKTLAKFQQQVTEKETRIGLIYKDAAQGVPGDIISTFGLDAIGKQVPEIKN